ncbi:MAG: ABC transporter permease subunit [Acidimicrobiia bacterium]|nr:ABC transporter permease subunit [Acidimicrobiia bacterium]
MKRRSWWSIAWVRFRSNKLAMFGVFLIGMYAAAAFVHPILMATVWDRDTYHPIYGHDDVIVQKEVVLVVTDDDTQIQLMRARMVNPFVEVGESVSEVTLPEPFTVEHPLGVDNLGRDVLSMVLAASTPSFVVGLSAAITTAVVGLLVATTAAYWRGPTDMILTEVSDTLQLLPAPLLMVILGAGPFRDSLGPLAFGLIYGVVAGASGAAIVLRSQALSVLSRPFIDATRVAGAGAKQIILRHLLPHLVPVAALYMLLGASGAIVADGFVSFLGFSNTRLNWGTIIFFAMSLPPANRAGIPWEAIIAAAGAISLFSAAFYLVGLGFRDIARATD